MANILSVTQEESDDLAKKLSEICRKHDMLALATDADADAAKKDGIIESACFGVRKRGRIDLS